MKISSDQYIWKAGNDEGMESTSYAVMDIVKPKGCWVNGKPQKPRRLLTRNGEKKM